nr:unnamed protein product [Spirometra erinaceieuropaei]
MKDRRRACKAEEIQKRVERNGRSDLFAKIEVVYGPTARKTAPLLSIGGTTLLTEKTRTRKRWIEHFAGVLNRSSTIFGVPIARLPQVETNAHFDLPPSSHELILAVQQLSSGKAPRSVTILPTYGSPDALFQKMWLQGQVSQDLKVATGGKGTANSATTVGKSR